MYCNQCGKKVEDGGVFCGNCGNRFGQLLDENVSAFSPATTIPKSYKKLLLAAIAVVLVISAGIGAYSHLHGGGSESPMVGRWHYEDRNVVVVFFKDGSWESIDFGYMYEETGSWSEDNDRLTMIPDDDYDDITSLNYYISADGSTLTLISETGDVIKLTKLGDK